MWLETMASSKDKVLKLVTICTVSLLTASSTLFPQSGREPVGKAPYSCPDKGHGGNSKILNTGIISLSPWHFEGGDPFGQRYLLLDSCSPAWENTKISSLKGFPV